MPAGRYDEGEKNESDFMPVSAKTRKTPTRRKTGQDSLPDRLGGFFASRLVDGFGLFLVGIALFLALSLLSHNPADPSLNTDMTDRLMVSADNWMGRSGAVLSDILVQAIGLGGLIWAVILGVWGWRVFRRLPFYGWPILRVICFAASAPVLALFLARIPDIFGMSGQAYLGGVFGGMLFNAVTQMVHGVFGGLVYWAVALLALVSAFFMAFIACGMSSQAWERLWYLTLGFFTGLWDRACRFVGWVKDHDRGMPRLRGGKAARGPKPRKAPVVEASAVASDDAPRPAPAPEPEIVTPKRKTPTPPKQTSLSLPDHGDWAFPPLEMLQEDPGGDMAVDERALQHNADLLAQVMADYNVEGEIVKVHPGPVVTLYEFEPAPGVKSSRVISLSDDIARSMSAVSVRVAVVPGRSVIGIEIPNAKRKIVYLRDIVEARDYEETKAKLPLVLGKDIGGAPIIADLAKMPHLLVAGTTGSGKSVAVNTMLLSLLYKMPPEKCRFIMIDPKMLELSVYDDIPHLLSPVVTDPGKAVVSLKWAVHEMETRYMAMSKLGVRNIEGYNARIREAQKKGENLTRKVQTGYDTETGKPVFEEQLMDLVELPYIVIIVDEFADLMLVAGKDVEASIQRLAQMARAAGLHIIMATQRPSVDVITGVIKANFPTRISFAVTSKIDSRTILGEGGAEQLLGMGDMLYMASGGRIKRVHGPFVADEEVEQVVDHLKAQAEPAYLEEVTEGEEGGGLFGGEGDGEGSSVDELYDEAVAVVAREGKASTSFIQRHLQIGYNRAARIIEEMERQGVVSPANRVGKREVLIGDHSGS